MDRRTFAKTGFSFGSIPLLALYPQRADAWFWFVARALVSFSGRTVGRQAARAAVRSVSRPVANRTRAYANRVRSNYPKKADEKSYPYAEYLGKELGQYGAESAFDYLYSLNKAQHGGASQVVVVDESRPEAVGVGFSTGNNAPRIADFHGSHTTALDTCSERLAKIGLTSAEITGLLYPVSGIRNNFSTAGYARVGGVSYKTPFGSLRMKSYYAGNNAVRADVFAQDDITGRYFKWQNAIA